MQQKKGVMPIILLLIGCVLLTIWVWKQETASIAKLEWTTFDLDRILAEEKPVLLNISSDNCPYCVMMEPDLAQIHKQYGEQAVVADINLDRCPESSWQLPVRATPTQILFYADGSPYLPSEAVQQEMTFLYYVTEADSTAEEVHVLTVHEGMLTAAQMKVILQDLGVSI